MSSWTMGYHAIEAALAYASEGVLWVKSDCQDKKRVKACVSRAEAEGLEVRLVSHDVGAEPARFAQQGVALELQDRTDVPEVVMAQASAMEDALILVLDGVQDPHNLGACIRTAAVFGAQAVVIPKHQSVGITATVKRIASGAMAHVPVLAVTNLVRFLKTYQQEDWWVYGFAEQGDRALFDVDLSAGKRMLVMGGEGKGLKPLTQKTCDHLLVIPSQSPFSTLNVSVAAGVALSWAVGAR